MINFENGHERLKKARADAGFKTAIKFCDKFQIPISTYNMHETGRRKLRPSTAEKYADLLGIDVLWLLTGKLPSYQENRSVPNTNRTHKINNQSLEEIPVLHHASPLLFCKIVINIYNAYSELNIKLALHELALEATNIYQDILKSSACERDQLVLVDFAITIFKNILRRSN